MRPPRSESAKPTLPPLTRRHFLQATTLAGAALALESSVPSTANQSAAASAITSPAGLPVGSAPVPLTFRHFPDRLHAFIWRNWMLVPAARLAEVVGGSTSDIVRIGRSMGLAGPPRVTAEQQRRSSITVLRRNWHLLPYEQLLTLLDWSPEHLATALREDDFLYEKLGGLKPKCEPLRYTPPSPETQAREARLAQIVREAFPTGPNDTGEPLFGFVEQLARTVRKRVERPSNSGLTPRFCYSYFGLYGDPLIDRQLDPYPDGYLRRLAELGVDGVWLQGVLHQLAPFPWEAAASSDQQGRLANLNRLVKRAANEGIGVYLYLNEPRAMPAAFFAGRAELQGVVEGEQAALCSSHPVVQEWLVEAMATVGRAVPDLAGVFTITASENLTNCWSHGGGKRCPRCRNRKPSEVVAEVNSLLCRGLQEARSAARFIAWDWGWEDDWAQDAIALLPRQAALMSVSEWGIPIGRGGILDQVGEYSISTIGPGLRAERHWDWARKCGLKTIAKIQASNTWELSAVPYIPALENVARHAANLKRARVDGLMLGWTLGGYPSPNLEVVAEITQANPIIEPAASPAVEHQEQAEVNRAMQAVATGRFGKALAPAMVQAWREFSTAFSQFPFDGAVVYNAPMQVGPSNLLWAEPTGYPATMVGFPYDDLDRWRGPYPVDIFTAQFEKVASGFESAVASLRDSFESHRAELTTEQQTNLAQELNVAEAASIHFRSTANQARFVEARRRLAQTRGPDRGPLLSELERLLRNEIALARRLHAIQVRDSRIGFEASNQYYYVPTDLIEKVLNCRDLLERWLPRESQIT